MARAPRDEDPDAQAGKSPRRIIALVPLTTAAGPARIGETVELSAADAALAVASGMAIDVPEA